MKSLRTRTRAARPNIRSHVFTHYGLGELPFFILAEYPHGIRDVEGVEIFLSRHPGRSSWCTTYLSGGYDLGIFGWFPADQLAPFIDELRSQLDSPKLRVIPIERISTPFQREQDVPDVRPTRFEGYFSKRGQMWVPLEGASGTGPNLGNWMKFYMVIRTRSGESDTVFDKLLQVFSDDADNRNPRFREHTVCTYRSDAEEGCLVSAYTEPGGQLRNKVFDLLNLDEEISSSTHFCLDVLYENDHPWPSSQRIDTVPNRGPLANRAVRAITGTEGMRGEDSRKIVPKIEEIVVGEGACRALLTYDPSYWWGYKRDVHRLIQQIVRGHSEAFLNVLMKRYIEIEVQVKKSLRRLFMTKRKKVTSDAELEHAILNHLGIQEFDHCVHCLAKAMDGIKGVNADQDVIRRVISEIGVARRYLKSLSSVEGRLTTGVVPRVVRKVMEGELIRPKKLGFGKVFDDPLMKDWETNLGAAAEDRNNLVHGTIVDAFDDQNQDSEGFGPWRRLLRNFIVTVPQANVLIRELNRAYEERCKKFPIRI